MRSWPDPSVPAAPDDAMGDVPVTLFDTAAGAVVDVTPPVGEPARLYVCGVTPYDSTHLGHAATYLAFDTLVRAWRDAGRDVVYAQNVTDVDDPLLERAESTGRDWRELADEQTELFRTDMAALRVVPPAAFTAVTEVVEPIAEAVRRLEDAGAGYRVETPGADGDDVYFDWRVVSERGPWHLGDESHLDRATMLALSAERGGDPERPGKRDALDPLLWRAAREGEPSWDSVAGRGRPGWHIECAVIALDALGPAFTVQGGGADLVFPHHEFSGGHAAALSGEMFASAYAHAGMVAYDGEKMSKSLGNLVLVSRLRDDGVDPRVIRLAVLAHRWRSDWEWTALDVELAIRRVDLWTAAADPEDAGEGDALASELRRAVRDDLDTPRAIALVDERVEAGGRLPASVLDRIDALLGIRI